MGDGCNSRLRFGVFEANIATGELRRNGRRVKLQPQAFKLLALLLERQGDLVSREEMHRSLWGDDTFVNFDQGLNFAIKNIRQALGDDADRPRYVETLPRRGYRFIAPIEPIASNGSATNGHFGAGSAPAVFAPSPQAAQSPALPGGVLPAPAPEPAAHIRWLPPVVAAMVLAAVGIALWLILSSTAAPRVLRSVQLTHSGRIAPDTRVLTDGTRLFVTERVGGTFRLAMLPESGGDLTPIPAPASNVLLDDIDATGANLLLSVGAPVSQGQLWVVPTVGGSPRRLDAVNAEDASWSPDARQIAFSHEQSLFIISADGSGLRKLWDAPGHTHYVRWSPDGRRISFTVRDLATNWRSLWQIGADGSNPHALPLRWPHAPEPRTGWGDGECCGLWTADGRYFVFRSNRQGVSSLWALPDTPRGLKTAVPTQLYTSPDEIGPPSVSRDQKRLYFTDHRPQRELVRYDAAAKRVFPYLSGIPARYVSLSPDGQWVAYRNESDGSLWRSRIDGSEPLQLTFAPMQSQHSSWSPDGQRIVLDGSPPGGPAGLFVVPSHGGPTEPLFDNAKWSSAGVPSWSPDGQHILFHRSQTAPGLYLFDLRSHTIAPVPDSTGFQFGQWSPDARYILAVGANSTRLLIYDLSARKWSELVSDVGIYRDGVRWSPDSKSIFYQEIFLGEEEPVFRIDVATRKIEKVMSYSSLDRADAIGFSLTGLAPDGSPLASLIRSESDIYALDITLP